MGDERLLHIAQPVPEFMFRSAAMDELIGDLLDTMEAASGARATDRLVGVSHNSLMNWVCQEVAGLVGAVGCR